MEIRHQELPTVPGGCIKLGQVHVSIVIFETHAASAKTQREKAYWLLVLLTDNKAGNAEIDPNIAAGL